MLYRYLNKSGWSTNNGCEKGWWLAYYSGAHFRFFLMTTIPIGDWWWITGPYWWNFGPWILWFVCFTDISPTKTASFWGDFRSIYQERFPSAIGCPVSTPVDMVVYPTIYRVSYMLGGCLGFLPSTVAYIVLHLHHQENLISQVSHYSSIELPIDITP